ncbi:MAG: hypothetical protein HQL21_06425 [Candidatus Omnitrophica bacterium]|nr:hypothetical protein [Candidatus Omnitrophota bacterium]
MKKIAFQLFMTFSLLTPAIAMERVEADQLFTQAGQAYKDGQLNEAIGFNEKIIAGGFESSAVYYNLGNAYLKKKALGKAIANYLRSERMSPRDADVRANLAFARSNVEFSQPFSSTNDVEKVLLLNQASEEELRWMALMFFMMAGTFVLVGLYKKVRTKRIILWTVLLSCLWIYCVAVLMMRMVSEDGHAVVIKGVEAKYEPSQGATTYFKLFEGAEVRVLKREDMWLKIERSDGKAAWVSVDAVEQVLP